MKPTFENVLIAIKNPEAIAKSFKSALEVELKKRNVDLGVPKTFSADAVGSQAVKVEGLKEVTFNALANGSASFPQGEHFLASYIRIYTGVNAVVNDTIWTAGNGDIAELQNATIDVFNSGTRVLKDYPLTQLDTSAEQNDSGYLVLTSPIWWLAQTELTITVKFKGTVPVLNQNLKIEIGGPKYIS